MRTAVMRVVVDAEGVLSTQAYESGLVGLRERGLELVASPAAHLPSKGREIELILDDEQLAKREEFIALCSEVFGTPAAAGVVTYISRGTDDDALRVLDAFKIHDARVERTVNGDDECVTVTMDRHTLRRVAEGRLHTALEAALNCEVRIEAAPGSVPEGAP